MNISEIIAIPPMKQVIIKITTQNTNYAKRIYQLDFPISIDTFQNYNAKREYHSVVPLTLTITIKSNEDFIWVPDKIKMLFHSRCNFQEIIYTKEWTDCQSKPKKRW